jgi:hypothetical protein
VVEWDQGGLYGGEDEVYVVSGNAADWSSGHFIDEELWVGSDNSKPTVYWTEVGYTYGPVAGYNGPGPNWFWADNRPGGGYHEHIPPGFQSPNNFLNQSITVAATYAGSSSWSVYIAGFLAGTSTSNPGVSGGLATGLEVYSGNNSSYLNQSNDGYMDWFNSSGTRENGWGSGTYVFGGGVSPPLTGGWYITDDVWVNSLP